MYNLIKDKKLMEKNSSLSKVAFQKQKLGTKLYGEPNSHSSTKFPLYQGIFIKEEDIDECYDHGINCLKQLKVVIPNIEDEISGIYSWSFPKEPHVTTLYMGRKKPTGENAKIFETFITGLDYPLHIKAILYIPKQIVVGITQINREEVLINNKFDHITLHHMKSPMYSNDVLKAAFDAGSPGEADYASGFSGLQSTYKEYNLKINGSQVSGYLIIPNKQCNFVGRSDFFY